MNTNFKMTATTLKGLEGVLSEELKKLGAQDIKEGIRSVTFRGDQGFLYKANIALRTAIRILKPIRRSEERRVGKECRSRWSPYH